MADAPEADTAGEAAEDVIDVTKADTQKHHVSAVMTEDRLREANNHRRRAIDNHWQQPTVSRPVSRSGGTDCRER